MPASVVTVHLSVNGKPTDAEIDVRLSLAEFLRANLGLTGTHLGCEQGACGACTVLVDGRSVRSCLQLAVQANGRNVETIEGVSEDRADLDPIQIAFKQHYAVQCGFCTPGMIMAAIEMRNEGQRSWTDAEIRDRLSGNLCRCTGYVNIVRAIDAALGGRAKS